MTDDLVTRLRQRADAIADCYDDSYDLLREAADEVAALKADRDRTRAVIDPLGAVRPDVTNAEIAESLMAVLRRDPS